MIIQQILIEKISYSVLIGSISLLVLSYFIETSSSGHMKVLSNPFNSKGETVLGYLVISGIFGIFLQLYRSLIIKIVEQLTYSTPSILYVKLQSFGLTITPESLTALGLSGIVAWIGINVDTNNNIGSLGKNKKSNGLFILLFFSLVYF